MPQRFRRLTRGTTGALLLILICGAYLRIQGLSAIGLVADELEDLELFQDLVQRPNPFADASQRDFALDQARLPFYVTAGLVQVTGAPVLPIARAVSVASALLVIVLVFLLGRALFTTAVGLTAATFQAVSIYDIGFSRFGFTSSASLFVAGFLLSMFCWHRAITTRRLSWCWLTGMMIGLSMAAKFFGVFALCIVGVWLWRFLPKRPRAFGASDPQTPVARRILVVNTLVMTVFGCLAVLSIPSTVKLTVFLAVALLTVGAHIRLLRHKQGTLTEERPLTIGIIIVLFAGIYCFLGSPLHLDLRRIVMAMEWLTRWHNAPHAHTALWDFVVILFVRLNLPFNVLFGVALFDAMAHRRRRSYQLLLLAFVVPFAILSASRWKTTGYLMMVFPICYLMVAALLVRDVPRMMARRRPTRMMAIIGLMLSVGWYSQQLVTLHPHEQIDGYRLGRAFIGWHRPSFVTFEGLPTMTAWLDRHVPRGSVVACIPIVHPVYNMYAYAHLIRYRNNRRIRYQSAASLADALRAPYVITSLYSEALEAPLAAAGYIPVKTFWLKDLRYGVIHATAEGAARLLQPDEEQSS